MTNGMIAVGFTPEFFRSLKKLPLQLQETAFDQEARLHTVGDHSIYD